MRGSSIGVVVQCWSWGDTELIGTSKCLHPKPRFLLPMQPHVSTGCKEGTAILRQREAISLATSLCLLLCTDRIDIDAFRFHSSELRWTASRIEL
jgi:hypothetical protein